MLIFLDLQTLMSEQIIKPLMSEQKFNISDLNYNCKDNCSDVHITQYTINIRLRTYVYGFITIKDDTFKLFLEKIYSSNHEKAVQVYLKNMILIISTFVLPKSVPIIYKGIYYNLF